MKLFQDAHTRQTWKDGESVDTASAAVVRETVKKEKDEREEKVHGMSSG